MANYKFVKKAEPTESRRSSARQAAVAATEEETKKPVANTKAKVTKTAASNGTAKGALKKVPQKTDVKSTGKAGMNRLINDTMDLDVKPKASRKRKSSEEPTVETTKKVKLAPKGPVINQAPTQKLDVFVFGEGSSGELGLGTKKAIDVKRPRLNANLNSATVGVVQIAAGGMHVAALTHDNKILTWGVNDQGALGRDTAWEGGLKDIDAAEDSDSDADDDEADLNPREATPTAIPSDKFPEGTTFVQVAAGDSTTFALTDDGQVWGWGTFRSNEGVFGFSIDSKIQTEPKLLPGLKKIKKIVCGANHVLALDDKGSVFAWGSGQQNQLGRRVVERTKIQGLIPREFGLPKKQIVDIECGQYHSFAIDNKDRVWAWGLNNYGETGIPESAGEDDAVIFTPEQVESLSGKGITCINGGAHHSIAVTGNGDCLTWGRVDGFQTGIKPSDLPESDVVKDSRGAVRILKVPTKVPIPEPVATARASSDHCIAVTKDGKAYSWGFSANYQTGQGTDDDVEIATLIDNTAIRGKHLNGTTTGGQFGILTAPAAEAQSNGVH